MNVRLCVLAVGVALASAGCGGSDDTPTEVVLVTHDSFAISPDVKQAFESESRLKLRILKAGDAGEIVTRALLTAGNPEGDVLFGVDNNLLQRTLDGDVFEAYESPELASVAREVWVLDPEHRVTPIDHGEVCLNYDKAWFAERGTRPPTSLADLTMPRYRDLLVVENPATSTPGLAFMLATIAQFGETAGRTTGASCARTACSSSTAGRTPTTRASPAQRAARGSGRSSSPTLRARRRR